MPNERHHEHDPDCASCYDHRVAAAFESQARSLHAIARSVHILVKRQLDGMTEEEKQQIAEMAAQLDAATAKMKGSAAALGEAVDGAPTT